MIQIRFDASRDTRGAHGCTLRGHDRPERECADVDSPAGAVWCGGPSSDALRHHVRRPLSCSGTLLSMGLNRLPN
jgi:hypothetical protein